MNRYEDYVQDFMNEVHTRADVDNVFTAEAFTMEACRRLVEMGEVGALESVQHFEGATRKGGRIAVDAADLDDGDESIALGITLFTDDNAELKTADLKSQFTALGNFLRASVDGSFERDQELSTPAYDLAVALRERGRSVSRYRLFLLTNAPIAKAAKTPPDDLLNLIPVEHHLWDLGRFHDIHLTAQGHVPLDIDLTEFSLGGLQALEVDAQQTSLRVFLASVPAPALADLYARYGSRLLEGNVRSFLSARGKVNKGIQATLNSEPHRFLAYNNGVTATAEKVTFQRGRLTRVSDLQIVNGGQTTASLFYARKDKHCDLSGVAVQMKLVVVGPDEAQEMVPLISRYANSQNKVNEADFFSNSPFHRRMEELSRRLLTPARGGDRIQTKWFYERNRGQYQNELAKLTSAERKREESKSPKSQVITKTDAAMYLTTFARLPHVVSSGSQKNFTTFAGLVQQDWNTNPDRFNEVYFKELVAKAILYRNIRREIARADWYDKGYLANLTTYSLARIAHDVLGRRGAAFPFQAVWDAQDVPRPIVEAALIAAQAVLAVLVSPTRLVANVTEWAKREACWDQVRAASVEYPSEFWALMDSREDVMEAKRAAAATQRLDGQLETMRALMEATPEDWKVLQQFARRHRLITGPQNTLVEKMMGGGNVPTERQVDTLAKLLKKAGEAGYRGILS